MAKKHLLYDQQEDGRVLWIGGTPWTGAFQSAPPGGIPIPVGWQPGNTWAPGKWGKYYDDAYAYNQRLLQKGMVDAINKANKGTFGGSAPAKDEGPKGAAAFDFGSLPQYGAEQLNATSGNPWIQNLMDHRNQAVGDHLLRGDELRAGAGWDILDTIINPVTGPTDQPAGGTTNTYVPLVAPAVGAAPVLGAGK